MFAIFCVQVDLTAKGIANWPQVVGAVHGYLAMLRRAGPQERVFAEIQRAAEVQYGALSHWHTWHDIL